MPRLAHSRVAFALFHYFISFDHFLSVRNYARLPQQFPFRNKDFRHSFHAGCSSASSTSTVTGSWIKWSDTITRSLQDFHSSSVRRWGLRKIECVEFLPLRSSQQFPRTREHDRLPHLISR